MTVAEARAITPPDVQERLATLARFWQPTQEQLEVLVRLFSANPAREA